MQTKWGAPMAMVPAMLKGREVSQRDESQVTTDSEVSNLFKNPTKKVWCKTQRTNLLLLTRSLTIFCVLHLVCHQRKMPNMGLF